MACAPSTPARGHAFCCSPITRQKRCILNIPVLGCVVACTGHGGCA
jgi:hypothetical protein